MSLTMTPMNGLYACEFGDIRAKAVDETYRIFVARPPMMEPGKTYPAIYLLDGNGCFGAGAEIQRLLAMGGELVQAFVIGIGYAVDNGFMGAQQKRFRDYTPTPGGELEVVSAGVMAGEYKPGGGLQFLRFLRDELKPAIEAMYPVDPADATIGGASLGGLFPSWVLLTEPEAFQRYVIISPSIWWNGEEVWKWEEACAAKRKDIAARVFVTAGGRETAALIKAQATAMMAVESPLQAVYQKLVKAYEHYGWPRMAEITPLFVDKLKSRNYPGLVAHCHNLPEETHMSIMGGALSRGFRYVFDTWRPEA